MFKTVILLLVSVASCAIGATIRDGRIVGGAPTTIEQYPYQASVQYSGSHICGGIILSETFILTAAHCTVGKTAGSLSVRVGSTYRNSGGQVFSVKSISRPPNYISTSKDYDAALLKLSTPITFGNSASKVNMTATTCPNDLKANVTGWGALSYGGDLSSVLNKVELNTISSQSCRDRYYPSVTARMICATAPGKDSCTGDAGGPLVSNGILYGIISWNFECGNPTYPGIYTDVSSMRTWILQVTGF